MLAHGLASSFFRTSVPAVAVYGIFRPPIEISCWVFEVVSTAGGAGKWSELEVPGALDSWAAGAPAPRPPRPGPWASIAEASNSAAASIENDIRLIDVHSNVSA